MVAYAAGLPSVDSKSIVLWGMSFGAAVSACAVAVDRRPKALVMVCPLLSFVREDRRERALAQVIRDRQSQLRGNAAFSLQPFNQRGDNPIGSEQYLPAHFSTGHLCRYDYVYCS